MHMSSRRVCDGRFVVFSIKKKRKGMRVIYRPTYRLRRHYRDVLPILNMWQQVVLTDSVHGFYPGRSLITNAEPHVGYRFTLTVDLSNFFDSIPLDGLKTVDKTMNDFVHFHPGGRLWSMVVQGFPRQGLPTSPAVANLAFHPYDQKIRDMCDRLSDKVVYTRYADDLSFSSDNVEVLKSLRDSRIPALIKPLEINTSKSRIQHAGFDLTRNRIITGVAVSAHGVHVSRRTRRKLRAAFHQNPSSNSCKGLLEFNRLRRPKRVPTNTRQEVSNLTRLYMQSRSV